MQTAERIRQEKPACTVQVFDIADEETMRVEIANAGIFVNATIVGMKPMENESWYRNHVAKTKSPCYNSNNKSGKLQRKTGEKHGQNRSNPQEDEFVR